VTRHPLAYLPSPDVAQVNLGPFPIRFYALSIIVGIAVAVWVGERRWRARGGEPNVISDIAIWAVPFGLVGGRLYHVITDYELYFTRGRDWVKAFYIWDGGLGIWGAIALGALGAWIGARRIGVRLPPIADAIAPGIALAQAVGRWGNWFNNELYGDRTTKPWGLAIHCMDDSARRAVPCSGVPGTTTIAGYYQPTFLYESIWLVIVAVVVIWADWRFKLGHGRAFALYVISYTIGRGWIEHLRSDYAHHIAGLRLNDWTAIIVGVSALIGFIISARRHPGRERPAQFYWPHFQPSGSAETAQPTEGTAAGVADQAAEPEAGGARPKGRKPRGPGAGDLAAGKTGAGKSARDSQPTGK
jgi:prolipoprotein diacylglyceryl transferase